MLNIVNLSNIEEIYYYKNSNNDQYSPFTGILYSKNNEGKISSEIEIVNGLKHGLANFYNSEGCLHNQIKYVNNKKDGFDIALYPNGKKKRESIFKKGKHIKSSHYDKNNNIIENLYWFYGNIDESKIKIRKYQWTNRCIYSQNLIWLDPIISGVISHLLTQILINTEISKPEDIDLQYNKYDLDRFDNYIYKIKNDINHIKNNLYNYSYLFDFEYNSNYVLWERHRTKNVIKFKNPESKKYIKKCISMLKKHFNKNYKLIFNNNKIDDIRELCSYKALIHHHTFSSSIFDENIRWNFEKQHKIFKKDQKKSLNNFKTKYLKIFKNTNDEFKDFIVIDNSVKPAGIVFESKSEEECRKWIKTWEK